MRLRNWISRRLLLSRHTEPCARRSLIGGEFTWRRRGPYRPAMILFDDQNSDVWEVHSASNRDYRCIVLGDCTAELIAADAPRSNHEASLLAIEILFGWTAESGAVIDARRRCLVGWCTNKASTRTFRSLIGRAERMAHSRARTSRGDRQNDVYHCPAGKTLSTSGTEPARKVPRSIHEGARDRARDIAKTAEGDHRRGQT